MIASTPAASSDPASSWSGRGGIVQVVDLHAAEHSWEVSPGAVVHGYGFNAQVPGPVIEAMVGDRLLVQFSNGMDQPSALVWKAPPVAGLSTSTPDWVLPGESHQSELTLTQPGAFVYWATSQPSRPNTLGGLYGVLLVRGPTDPAVDEERILIVHHAELVPANRVESHSSAPGMVRTGTSLLLISGMRHASIGMRAGSRECWRILNMAADIQLQLTLPTRSAPVTGGDDSRLNGRAALPRPFTTLPAAGLTVQVGPYARGQQVSLAAVPTRDGPAAQHRQLLTCRVT